MTQLAAKTDVIRQLQKEVLSLQGFKPLADIQSFGAGLGTIERSFPGGIFPTGTVHELISHTEEDSAATNGFIAGLLGKLMLRRKSCVWISTKRTIFPPVLKLFGIEPSQVMFIDVARQSDALWAIEEALKCNALAAVIGEIREVNFTESRRLQLAVEKSKVTGFIHRTNPKSENTVACVTRWKIRQLSSVLDAGMPGVGYPRWSVQLLKVRNGRPGTWHIEWSGGDFQHIAMHAISIPDIQIQTRKTG